MESDKSSWDAFFWDYAVVIFDGADCTKVKNGVHPNYPGSGSGSLDGIWDLSDSTLQNKGMNNRGYPGQNQKCGPDQIKCGIRIWGSPQGFQSSFNDDFVFFKDIYISPGHSGSALHTYEPNKKRYAMCIAVGVYTDDYEGFCRRLNKLVFNFIIYLSPDYS